MSMAVSPLSSKPFTRAVVVMGVTSCGKSTIGAAIAAHFGIPFIEGDKLHPPENIEKMSAGIPLTDDDRWPWLHEIGSTLSGEEGRVASCSALKRSYRKFIVETAGKPVWFVHLHGNHKVLEARGKARKGHFMPPSLLASQLATLELPGPDEHAATIDIDREVNSVVEEAIAFLLNTVD